MLRTRVMKDLTSFTPKLTENFFKLFFLAELYTRFSEKSFLCQKLWGMCTTKVIKKKFCLGQKPADFFKLMFFWFVFKNFWERYGISVLKDFDSINLRLAGKILKSSNMWMTRFINESANFTLKLSEFFLN